MSIKSKQNYSFCLINWSLFALLLIIALFLASPSNAKTVKPRFKRIVSLKPNITQTLIKLGVGEQIVGVTKFCPKSHDGVKVVADYNSIDLESLMRLKPDLVLTSSENSQSRQFQTLQGSKIPIKLFEFRSYPEFKASLAAIANLLGLKQQGDDLILSMDQQLSQLQDQVRSKSPIAKTFIVVVQRQPLMVASGKTYISSLLSTVGLQNAFASNQIAYPVIDEEELIREMADYTFDLSHDLKEGDQQFLNKTVIPLKIDHYLASPQSVDHLVRLFQVIN